MAGSSQSGTISSLAIKACSPSGGASATPSAGSAGKSHDMAKDWWRLEIVPRHGNNGSIITHYY